MKKTFIVVILLAGLLWSAAAQDIGICMPGRYQRWILEAEIMRRELAALGYSAEALNADNSVSTQIRQVERFVAKGVKVLIIASIDGYALTRVLKEARSKGIVIIAYDRLIREPEYVEYCITVDYHQICGLQGQAIVDALDLDSISGQKTIALFAGSPDDKNALLFYDAAIKVLTPYILSGKLKVIGGYAEDSRDIEGFKKINTIGWNAEYAKARMERILAGMPADEKLDAVLSPADHLTHSIVAALEKDPRYRNPADLPVITGQDAPLTSLKDIIDGKQYMTVLKDARILARKAAALADMLIRGGEIDIADTRVGLLSHLDDNEYRAVLLKGIPITKENIKEYLYDTEYYTKEEFEEAGIRFE